MNQIVHIRKIIITLNRRLQIRQQQLAEIGRSKIDPDIIIEIEDLEEEIEEKLQELSALGYFEQQREERRKLLEDLRKLIEKWAAKNREFKDIVLSLLNSIEQLVPFFEAYEQAGDPVEDAKYMVRVWFCPYCGADLVSYTADDKLVYECGCSLPAQLEEGEELEDIEEITPCPHKIKDQEKWSEEWWQKKLN